MNCTPKLFEFFLSTDEDALCGVLDEFLDIAFNPLFEMFASNAALKF